MTLVSVVCCYELAFYDVSQDICNFLLRLGTGHYTNSSDTLSLKDIMCFFNCVKCLTIHIKAY